MFNERTPWPAGDQTVNYKGLEMILACLKSTIPCLQPGKELQGLRT